MQHELAELLITTQIRRIHAIQHMHSIARQLAAPPHVSTHKSALQTTQTDIIQISNSEANRLELEVKLIQASLQSEFDPDEFLPFELKMEQFCSGNTLRDVFMLANLLQMEFLDVFQNLAKYVKYESVRFKSVLRVFQGLLEVFFRGKQGACKAETSQSSQNLQTFHSKIFRRGTTKQVQFDLIRACYSDLEIRASKMSNFEKISVFLREEKQIKIRKEANAQVAKSSQYRPRVRSIYEQQSTQCGKELHEIRKSVRKNVYGGYSDYVKGSYQSQKLPLTGAKKQIPQDQTAATESQGAVEIGQHMQDAAQNAQAPTSFKLASFDHFAAPLTATPTYHQPKPSKIYPLPPSIDEITAFAVIEPPFQFQANASVLTLEKLASSKFEQQIFSLHIEQIEQIEMLQFSENLLNFGRWTALESGEIGSIARALNCEFCAVQKGEALQHKRQNTQQQQQMLSDWGERVLQIASRRPIPERYAPILTSCGRFTRYLDITTGKTTNIHPEVVKAQAMISNQCMKLDKCIKIDPESSIFAFETFLHEAGNLIFLQGMKNLKGVCLVDIVSQIGSCSRAFGEQVARWRGDQQGGQEAGGQQDGGKHACDQGAMPVE
ncbi:hypothetical protein SS50377_22626 [Spironucleus salmonicida]|uniref:Uncharacterized protein n=1 Tax=Spironucleus salmonicida TaxID=348837 RepID=V6LRV8_9EUKA|nr:hypothetical protein SS50377_22626 [Spironucleus salmonicida]|eukprot:EST47310.1 hypothetical protein SS50377_12628 [Spironucleus salmonicida]